MRRALDGLYSATGFLAAISLLAILGLVIAQMVARWSGGLLPGGATYDVAWAYGYNPAGQVVTQTQSNDLYAFTGRSAATDTYTNNGLNQVTLVNATGVTVVPERRSIPFDSMKVIGSTALLLTCTVK